MFGFGLSWKERKLLKEIRKLVDEQKKMLDRLKPENAVKTVGGVPGTFYDG